MQKKKPALKFGMLKSVLASRLERDSTVPRIPKLSYRGQDQKIPSLKTTEIDTYKKDDKVYSGSAMIGIGQTHKSNAIPIFSKQEAIDISKMRR